MDLLSILLIFIINICSTSSRKGQSEWLQQAFNKHQNVMQTAKKARKHKRPPLDNKDTKDKDDFFDSLETDDKSKQENQPPPMMKTLDPLNILNKQDYGSNQFANPMEMHDFETQHSFQHPVDMMSQNWVLVGDAVATTNFARLTPEDSGRRGVLWNKFSLHLKDWQILLEINIHSKTTLGGDGFGVWLLDENEIKRGQIGDKQVYTNPNYELLLGDFYGLRRDFNGTGIIFDTYDNDNNGDNPLVFSLINDGKPKAWHFNNDLTTERDVIQKDLNDVAFHPMAKHLFPTECTLNYHQKESVKILIRYQNQQLHVYTDLEHKKIDGAEAEKMNLWKNHALPFAFGRHLGVAHMLSKMGIMPVEGPAEIPHLCLVRTVDVSLWNNPHIALSAITGQLADAHDILKLETKFLRKEHKIKDESLVTTGYSRRRTGIVYKVFWFIICIISVGLICETISEIVLIRKIYKENRHVVKTINRLNPFIQLSYYLNLAQYILLIFSFNWKCLLCNAPLLLIRIQKFMTNDVLLTPYSFEKPTFLYRTTYRQWLWVQLCLLCLSGFYHFWRLFHV
eukprot:48190_1